MYFSNPATHKSNLLSVDHIMTTKAPDDNNGVMF